MTNQATAPKHIRRTAFGRLAFDVDCLRQTPASAKLTSDEYLLRLASEKSRLLRMSNLLLFASMGGAIFLYASTGGYDVSLSVFGVSVTNLKITADVLALVTAILYGYHFSYLYSYYAIHIVFHNAHAAPDALLNKLLYVDKAGDNAIGLLITPRTIGYKSTIGHQLVLLPIMLLLMCVYAAMLLTPAVALVGYALPLLNDRTLNFSDTVATFALAMSTLCVGSFLLLIFPFKYVRD